MAEEKLEETYSKQLTGWERANFSKTLTCMLKEVEGHITTVELRSEIEVTGHVTHVDGAMNINMKDVTYRIPYRPEQKFETMHIHGSQIRFVHIPDQINMSRAIANQLNTHTARKAGPRKRPIYLDKKREERARILTEHAAKTAAAAEGSSSAK